MPTNKPRFSLTLDDDMFQKIEDFRFANRYQTRSDAIVELLKLGMAAIENDGVDSAYGVPHSEEETDRLRKLLKDEYAKQNPASSSEAGNESIADDKR